MSKIYYAVEVDTVEVDTGAVLSSTTYGLTYGYLRFITDRPIYTGTETGDALLPIGDNSVIKINLSGAETLAVAMASGQLYAATSDFKAINTVMNVRDRFTVLDNSDFTGGTLATAKGSAPAEGDMFEVTNNTPGYEAVKYVGINKWFEDFITRDGMSNPSRCVDLEGSGDYGTLSGFTFEVKDTIVAGTDNPFWKYIAANSINLSNRPVRVYAVIDDVFWQIWTGIVDSNPRTETGFTFECKSNFKAIHREIPPEKISLENYPNCGNDNIGQVIPVIVGDVIYSKLMTITGETKWIELNENEALTAMAYAYDHNESKITLVNQPKITPSGSSDRFIANELAGKYLMIASGGGDPIKDYAIRIISNLATSILERTEIQLTEPIYDENGIAFNLSKYGYSGSEQYKWCFRIADAVSSSIISNKAITSLKPTEQGTNTIYYYDKDKNEYVDIKAVFEKFEATNSLFYGKSTISYINLSLLNNADCKYLYPIRILGKYYPNGDTYGNLPRCDDVHGMERYSGSLGFLNDYDRSTKCIFKMNHNNDWNGGPASCIFEFTIHPDSQEIDEIFFCADLKINVTTVLSQFVMKLSITDQYGRYTLIKTIGYPSSDGVTFSLIKDYNMLPNDFYKSSLGNGDNGETSRFGINDLSPSYLVRVQSRLEDLDIDYIKNLNASVNAKVECLFYNLGYDPANPTETLDIKIDFKQLGVVASRKVDVVSLDLYSRVSGEKTKTDAAESNTVYNAFRLMLETYDDIPSADIDYGNLPTVRHNLPGAMWHVGRQLTERKNTADYIKELCENSFVAAFQNRKGKLAFSAWRERVDAALVHDNTSIIRDSISDWAMTSIDRVFNSFTVNYSSDPGGDKYFSTYQIKDVDSATYPTGGGIQHLWNICHAAYLAYNSVKEFEIDLPWFIDRARWYNEGEAGDGLGADGSAYKWLLNAVYWMTRQKRTVNYKIPLNTTTIVTELCDRVNFRDPVYTNSLIDGAYIVGAVQTIEYDLQSDSIIISPILNPDDTIDNDYGDIIETGSAADTITESGAETDTITENGN